MNELSLNREKLEIYRNDVDIVHKTALQVIKDFAQFGYEKNFPADLNLAYQDLFHQLLPTLRELMNIDMTRFYSLLYYIDLNEHSIKKGIKEMDEIPLEEVLAHLLLERELKKVITREHFKKSSQ
jgi:hypothetical protein